MDRRLWGLLPWVLGCACGGSGGAPASGPSAPPRTPQDLAGAEVYDASGEVLKAEMLLNHATLKHSYANYEAEAAAL